MSKEKKNVVDVMLDLETLGKNSSPVITQISAVACNLETGDLLGDEFNELVSPMSCVKHKFDIDASTLIFWLSQDKEVIQKVLVNSITHGKEITQVLEQLSNWVNSVRNKYNADLRIWGNGLLSDGIWIERAYEKCGMKVPYTFREPADVRTLVDIGVRLLGINPKDEIPFEGEKHNAIDDCKHQIKYCSLIYKEIKNLKGN